MGPGFHGWSSLGEHKKKSPDHESSRRMVISKRGKRYLNTKETKPTLPPVRVSAIKPANSISSSSQKVLQSPVSHVQPGYLDMERTRICPAHQQNRIMNACSSTHRTQGSLTDLSERKPSASGLQKAPCSLKSSMPPSAERAQDALLQSFYISKKCELGATLQGPVAGASASTSRHQGDPVEHLFMDFESLRLIKEDADEDSASDLSDSERIPIAPSPFTPPDLNLRAEKIDPASFDHLFEFGFKESEYYYSDILPPPFNSWDLSQLAVFVNTEGKHTSRPQPAGLLEKYVDRLLQLEWLQMQTIQNEKAKACKLRPHTAPSNFHHFKSPGKSKSWHNPLPSRMPVPPEGLSTLPPCHSSNIRRKGVHCEETSSLWAPESYPRVADVTHAKPDREIRPMLKKRQTESNKQQLLELQPSASISKVQGIGSVRPPKHPSAVHSLAPPFKGTKTNGNPKKNATANSGYLPPKKAMGDRKVKTNGVKQSTCKCKPV